MRIKEPKTTALIFSSGKMVCTGAKSVEDSKKASKIYAKIIRKIGGYTNIIFKDFKVQNIVGSCDLHFKINLSKLAGTLSMIKIEKSDKNPCSYLPELFPGLIYHMVDPDIVSLIFYSGKIVLTGAKKTDSIFIAFDNLYKLLSKYKYKGDKTSKELHKEDVKNKEKIKEEKKN